MDIITVSNFYNFYPCQLIFVFFALCILNLSYCFYIVFVFCPCLLLLIIFNSFLDFKLSCHFVLNLIFYFLCIFVFGLFRFCLHFISIVCFWFKETVLQLVIPLLQFLQYFSFYFFYFKIFIVASPPPMGRGGLYVHGFHTGMQNVKILLILINLNILTLLFCILLLIN